MTLSGTITDFDEAGLFGLILADEGFFFPFNLRETPPALRVKFSIGTRVNFITCASGATMRATELVPIEATESLRVTGPSGLAEGR